MDRHTEIDALTDDEVMNRLAEMIDRAAGWTRCDDPTSVPAARRCRRAAARGVEKPLATDWQAQLCTAPLRILASTPELHLDENADWAARAYACSSHPDGRIRDRIMRMGRAWLTRLGAPVPVIFPRKAECKAAYRLLSNKAVTMEHILEPHQETMVDRCRQERVILAIQDTTTLNYNGLTADTRGPVGFGGGGAGSEGILAHLGLAVSEAGRRRGVFVLDTTFRDGPKADRDKESVRWLRGLERPGALEAACPQTRVVTVCDREGDFRALLHKATTQRLVVRASRAAKRKVLLEDGKIADLWDHVAALPVCATRTIDASGGARARKAHSVVLDLRAAGITLAPPNDTDYPTPITLRAVAATERTPRAGRSRCTRCR